MEKDYTPKPMTAGQNMMLMLKILGISAVVMGLLWLADFGNT